MNKLRATLDNGTEKVVVIVPNVTVDQAISALTDDLETPDVNALVEDFLDRTRTLLVRKTPDSSWVDAIAFDATNQQIIFVPRYGTEIKYPTTFYKFLQDLKTSSVGQLQWTYKRGQR